MENYKIEKLNNTDAVVISDEEIKINDSITDGYRVWYWRDNCSLLGRKKVIATIHPFKLEGLPMLELGKSHRIEILLKPEHIELLNGGNIKITNNKVEYTLPQKFINENDKWFIELPNQEEDIEKLAHTKYAYISKNPPYTIITPKDKIEGFIEGYKAAQKQYSEEDIRNAIEMAREVSGMEAVVKLLQNEYLSTEDFQYTEEEIIQSLQKKQFPTSVELTEDFKPLKWYYE